MTILVHEKDRQSEVLLFEIYGKSNANKAIFSKDALAYNTHCL